MRTHWRCGLLAAAFCLASADAAQAHIVAARLGDFYAGALHPFTDLQDLILWIAMGVLAGSLGAAKGRWLVVLFPLGLLTGLLLGWSLDVAVAKSAVTAALILGLGLLLVVAWRIPTLLLCALALLLAVVRGAANAIDLTDGTDRILFAAGLACAGYVGMTLVMALAVAFRGPEQPQSWRTIAIRALGGWIAAIGLMMLGLDLAS